MPFTGPVYDLPINGDYPAVAGNVIDPDDWNEILEDLATALSAVVTRDGSGTIAGNINMGTHKLTNLAAGTTAGDSVRYEQVQLANAFATAWEGAAWAAGKLGYATAAAAVALVDVTTEGLGFLNFTDPNVDAIRFWDDSAGLFANLTLGTGLTITGTTLSVSVSTALGYTPASNVVTLTAGLGISGGGDLSANRSFAFDPSELVDTASVASDLIVLSDASASGAPIKRLVSSFITDQGLPTLSGANAFTGNRNSFQNARTLFYASSEDFALELKNSSGGTSVFAGASSGGNFRVSNSSGSLIFEGTNDRDLRITEAPTTLAVNSVGFRGLGARNSQNATYTFVLGDAGRRVDHSSGTHTWTIPPESSVLFPDGTCIEVVCFAGTLTIGRGSGVALYKIDGSGTLTDANATIPIAGIAVLQKIGAGVNDWMITGSFT